MTQASEFRAGGKPLAAALLGVACGASPIPFNVIGFLFAPLNAEFGWSRGEVSIGITIFGVVASLLAPLYGSLADRIGVRPVALWSLAAFGLCFAAFALTPPSLIGFYALFLLLGLVGIGSTPVTWSRAISMWFFKNRGLALGVMLLGTSLSAMVVPSIVVWAIEGFGWRTMHVIIAALPLLVALPIGLLFFREPGPGERPAGIQTATGAVAGATLAEAMRDRRFWTLWVSILMIAFAYGGAHIHMPSIVADHGFSAGQAAGVMGVVGFGILSGRVITGLLLDRIWGPAVAFPILCLPALACWLLLGTSAPATQLSAAGFMLGFAAGAESDLIAFLAARYFGMAHFGKIYGMLYMPFGLFSAISPVVYGTVRDTTGSYDPILTAAMVIFVIGGALLLTLGRYPELGRAAPAGAEPQAA